MPVSDQRKVFQTSDLIFLSSDAQERAGNLAILRNRGGSDGLRERQVGLGIGGLDERPHEGLGGSRSLGPRCPCGNIHRINYSFDAICEVCVSFLDR